MSTHTLTHTLVITLCMSHVLFSLLQVLAGHRGAVTCGSFTPDGKMIVSAGGEGDSSVRAWNPKTGECTAILQAGAATPFHQEGRQDMAGHLVGRVPQSLGSGMSGPASGMPGPG